CAAAIAESLTLYCSAGVTAAPSSEIHLCINARSTDAGTGAAIGAIAAAHGKTADAVIAAMTADANAHIDQAVANGQMTAEQGAKAKEKAATAIARMVNSEGRPHGHGR
ncbi:MAG TPA: hypothetical protein PKA49_07730, partial [Tepidiformaceae bacterium]|nr:hypothetical protein [Tepidiformaceae bacterium]